MLILLVSQPLTDMTQAGSGISRVMFPPIIEWLVDQYGFETTLRLSATTIFLLSATFLYFHRPRLPVSKNVISVPFPTKSISFTSLEILRRPRDTSCQRFICQCTPTAWAPTSLQAPWQLPSCTWHLSSALSSQASSVAVTTLQQ